MHRNEQNADGCHDAVARQAQSYLHEFLQEHAVHLQKILCGHIAKLGLARGPNVEVLAAEVLQETALEAMKHAQRFEPQRMQTMAWLLGIALNILKRHKVRNAKLFRFEVQVGDVLQESDLLDQQIARTGSTPGPEQTIIAHESLQELLRLVPEDDARLLYMTLIQGWRTTELATMMGMAPGTIRVRIHRALSRLRQAWQRRSQSKEDQNSHG